MRGGREKNGEDHKVLITPGGIILQVNTFTSI
jgi:hypothetical protein